MEICRGLKIDYLKKLLSETKEGNKLRSGKIPSLMPAQSLSHNVSSVTKGEILAPVCMLTEHGF
jgi:hypothetical protein